MGRALCIAILACVSVALADSPTVTIPLKDIWAWEMPGTQDVRNLEPNNYGPNTKQHSSEERAKLEKAALAEQIREALSGYPWLPTAGAKITDLKSGFAVSGIGFEALQKAKRTLADKKEPSESFPADQDISVIFFSRIFGDYCHLDHVTRTGNHIEIAWRFVQHGNDWATEHFAIIPLGKLLPGQYEVKILQLQKPSDWGAKIVCKSFSFSVH